MQTNLQGQNSDQWWCSQTMDKGEKDQLKQRKKKITVPTGMGKRQSDF